MKTFVLNLSGVYEQERQAAGSETPFFARTPACELDFSDLPGTNCYCDDSAAAKISKEMSKAASSPSLRWIDTGDCHYLSKLLLSYVREPFCLLLLDHHPDEQESAFGCLSCGNWIAEAKRDNPYLKQVISIGPEERISNGEPETEFFPESVCVSDVSTRLPVYISLDLDILDASEFHTDWSQGSMTLDQLEILLKDIFAGHRILGIDVCGGKTVEKGATGSELSRNFSVRSRLQSMFDLC